MTSADPCSGMTGDDAAYAAYNAAAGVDDAYAAVDAAYYAAYVACAAVDAAAWAEFIVERMGTIS